MSESKEKEATVSGNHKSKTPDDNKDRQGEESEKVEEDPIDREGTRHGFEDFSTTTYKCSVTGKDRMVVWRNFDSALANMGIKRELIRTQVKENNEGRI